MKTILSGIGYCLLLEKFLWLCRVSETTRVKGSILSWVWSWFLSLLFFSCFLTLLIILLFLWEREREREGNLSGKKKDHVFSYVNFIYYHCECVCMKYVHRDDRIQLCELSSLLLPLYGFSESNSEHWVYTVIVKVFLPTEPSCWILKIIYFNGRQTLSLCTNCSWDNYRPTKYKYAWMLRRKDL